MAVVRWPNKMGWTVGQFDVEVTRCCGQDMLKVKSLHRIAIVGSTSDPEKAVELTQRYGYPRQELDSLGESMIGDLLRARIL